MNCSFSALLPKPAKSRFRSLQVQSTCDTKAERREMLTLKKFTRLSKYSKDAPRISSLADSYMRLQCQTEGTTPQNHNRLLKKANTSNSDILLA